MIYFAQDVYDLYYWARQDVLPRNRNENTVASRVLIATVEAVFVGIIFGNAPIISTSSLFLGFSKYSLTVIGAAVGSVTAETKHLLDRKVFILEPFTKMDFLQRRALSLMFPCMLVYAGMEFANLIYYSPEEAISIIKDFSIAMGSGIFGTVCLVVGALACIAFAKMNRNTALYSPAIPLP